MAKVFNRTSEKGRRRQLRHSMPEAEVIVWSRLKNRRLAGTKHLRNIFESDGLLPIRFKS
ncbi:MAG: DUF559 domain-containing protein [Ignavibacteriales bacterium]|nr:DUF559 domain-containing protein [Ignavibacteriales bacterium]